MSSATSGGAMTEPKITTPGAFSHVPGMAYGVADSGNGKFWFAVWTDDDGVPIFDIMAAPAGARIYVEVPDSVDVKVNQHATREES